MDPWGYFMSIDPQHVIAVAAILAFLANAVLAGFSYLQSRASRVMIDEVKRDRALATYPYLVATEPISSVPQPDGTFIQRYRIRNIGRGPALQVQLFVFVPQHGNVDAVWLFSAPVDLGLGHGANVDTPQLSLELLNKLKDREFTDLDEWQEWKDHSEFSVIICNDQFGKLHRFRPFRIVPETWVKRTWLWRLLRTIQRKSKSPWVNWWPSASKTRA